MTNRQKATTLTFVKFVGYSAIGAGLAFVQANYTGWQFPSWLTPWVPVIFGAGLKAAMTWVTTQKDNAR